MFRIRGSYDIRPQQLPADHDFTSNISSVDPKGLLRDIETEDVNFPQGRLPLVRGQRQPHYGT